MAFIDNQDEQDPNNPQGQNPLVGQGSSVVGAQGGGNTAAGVGPGGTGGWTNIQAYLDANKGNDTGSSQLLDKTVGGQFDQERQNFTNASQGFLNDAQGQVDKSKIDNNTADQYINQASHQYLYNGEDAKNPVLSGQPSGGSPLNQKVTPGSDQTSGYQPIDPSMQYSDIVNKFTHALNDKYSGPTQYNYALGDKTQQYGGDLKDNASFDSLMKNIYSGAAQNPLTSGQYELQKQFDVGNQALGDSRKKWGDQYDQLQTDRDKTVADTTSGLSNVEQSYRQNQNALSDYLSNKATDYDQQIGNAEAGARAGYQNSYVNERTGRTNAAQASGLKTLGDPYSAQNAWGSDLTPQQLQNEQNIYKQPNADNQLLYYFIDHPAPTNWPEWQTLRSGFSGNQDYLNNWYGGQDAKYANTADSQERAYNSIQDFLNSNSARKQKGFNVRV